MTRLTVTANIGDMKNQTNNIGPERSLNEMVSVAMNYLRLGFRPIPLVPGTKRGLIKWKPYQSRPPTEEEVRGWFGDAKTNIGLITGPCEGGGVVVVDVDDWSLLDGVIEHCGDTPMRCRTPSGGMHMYYGMRRGVHYGNAVRIKHKPIDLRCEGAYVVCPWSQDENDVPYEWIGELVDVKDLPPIRISWLRERRQSRVVIPASIVNEAGRAVRRARSYLAHIEGAVSGRHGHDRTFRVACVLTTKFGLTLEQAWPLFLEWNQQCEPPWSEKELLHKLQDAIKLRFVT